MNLNKSYVSRSDSSIVKGLLTILIVLGHDIVLIKPLEHIGFQSSLYLFHIQSFFILPFLYGVSSEPYGKDRLFKTLKRFYWPFLLLTVSFTLGYGIMTSFRGFSILNLIKMLTICDGQSIRQLCGIQIFWFLPSMMIMVLLKELYYRNSIWLKIVLIFLSLGINLLAVLNVSIPGITRLPLGANTAIELLLAGVTLRAIIDWIEEKKNYKLSLIICLMIFCSSLALYWTIVVPSTHNYAGHWMFKLMAIYTPVVFLVGLVSMLRLLKFIPSKWLLSIGEKSLYMYLISPFIGYLAAFVCQKLGLMYWWVGLLLWPGIIGISYFLTRFVRGKIETIVFPK